MVRERHICQRQTTNQEGDSKQTKSSLQCGCGIWNTSVKLQYNSTAAVSFTKQRYSFLSQRLAFRITLTLSKVLAVLWGTGWRLIVVGSFSKQATFEYHALQKGPYCLACEFSFLYQFKSGSKQFAYIWSPFPKLMVRGIWSCRYKDTLLLSALHHASTIYSFPANLCSHGQPTPAAVAHSAS